MPLFPISPSSMHWGGVRGCLVESQDFHHHSSIMRPPSHPHHSVSGDHMGARILIPVQQQKQTNKQKYLSGVIGDPVKKLDFNLLMI